MDVTQTALTGLGRAQERLQGIASRVARAGFPADGAETDTVDLSGEAVALIETEIAAKANIRVLQTQDDITKSVLDLLA